MRNKVIGLVLVTTCLVSSVSFASTINLSVLKRDNQPVLDKHVSITLTHNGKTIVTGERSSLSVKVKDGGSYQFCSKSDVHNTCTTFDVDSRIDNAQSHYI